ncbi:MAG: serine/threonine protein kinase [Deltaproteobacteria bacterium]|nr:MAG: serine/threonine protein kinase [Deltaproteobacteria bacterium]TMQ20889.1 MAG: serine/threonine protein kinase [Deltaproteobacteria bacterium]
MTIASADPRRPLRAVRETARDDASLDHVREVGLVGSPVVPRYVFLRRLGRGGMGVVDLVHDTVRDQVVARKRMRVDSADARVQCKREFRAVESLRHPSIVALHGLEEDEDGLFFTMEHVRGIDLRRYCRQGAASEAIAGLATTVMAPVDRNAITGTAPQPAPHRAADAAVVHAAAAGASPDERRLDHVLVQLIEALQFLHSAGVVHRDLKPSNVLVRDDGHVKVLDFGLATETAPWAATPFFAGTPAYMAPEQIRGQPCTPATDAYALGALLFEILAGRLPFLGHRGRCAMGGRGRARAARRAGPPGARPLAGRGGVSRRCRGHAGRGVGTAARRGRRRRGAAACGGGTRSRPPARARSRARRDDLGAHADARRRAVQWPAGAGRARRPRAGIRPGWRCQQPGPLGGPRRTRSRRAARHAPVARGAGSGRALDR